MTELQFLVIFFLNFMKRFISFFSVQAVEPCTLRELFKPFRIFCQFHKKLLPASRHIDFNVKRSNDHIHRSAILLVNDDDNEHSTSFELIDVLFVVCRVIDERLEVRRQVAGQSVGVTPEVAAARHLHGQT